MRKNRFLRAIKIVAIVVLAGAVFGIVIMRLWNWLVPPIFGLHMITFSQALGLFVFSKILFGGFHRHGGRRRWRRHMEDRWSQMTEDEREKLRSAMRGRRGGCNFGPLKEQASEVTPV